MRYFNILVLIVLSCVSSGCATVGSLFGESLDAQTERDIEAFERSLDSKRSDQDELEEAAGEWFLEMTEEITNQLAASVSDPEELKRLLAEPNPELLALLWDPNRCEMWQGARESRERAELDLVDVYVSAGVELSEDELDERFHAPRMISWYRQKLEERKKFLEERRQAEEERAAEARSSK